MLSAARLHRIGWYGNQLIANMRAYRSKGSWYNSRYYLDIRLKGVMKTMKSISEDNRCPCRYSNPALPEYKSEALTTKSTCSMQLQELGKSLIKMRNIRNHSFICLLLPLKHRLLGRGINPSQGRYLHRTT
jgi:hypothetical protein